MLLKKELQRGKIMKRMMILMGLLLTLLTQPLMAQPPAAGGDLEAIRVGYITKKLSLTTDEAKVFWPVYDAYRDEMKLVRQPPQGAGHHPQVPRAVQESDQHPQGGQALQSRTRVHAVAARALARAT